MSFSSGLFMKKAPDVCVWRFFVCGMLGKSKAWTRLFLVSLLAPYISNALFRLSRVTIFLWLAHEEAV
ncbi:hypothetical protein [Acetobacter tropicalis]|uniref:hypothetical protein n=1 Tax=Acetobacter tropicalis TaxID=104102 RepID=UPI0013050BFE|nr:hypothetical protein [Acetobacter tropicalis]